MPFDALLWISTALRRGPAKHHVRLVLGALLVVLACGGIPGSALRSIVRDLPAPPVPEEVTDRDGAVVVTVLDGTGGPPLAGAHVRALSIVEGTAYAAGDAPTDAAGHARFAKLARGELWILADAPGRARGSTHLVVDAEPRAVDIELGPEQAIDVTVSGDGGEAVAGAEIEALSANDPLPVGARTGVDGRAHVGRLGAGPWHVTAHAAGYEDAQGRAERDGDTVTLVARKLGAIAVRVVAGEGDESAPGARIAVAGATLWPPRSAEAGDRGEVRIGGLAAGSYALRATRGDLVSPIELGVTLARGEEKAVTLHLAPGRWVAVRVTDGSEEDAAPLKGARVTLAEGGLSPFPLESTTDAKGTARLGPVAPGGATVSARADGYVGHGAVAVADPPPAETRIALVRAGVLSGRVVDGRGYPVDGATIEIVGTDIGGAPIFDDPRRAGFQAAHFDAMLAGPAPLAPAGELGVMAGPVPAIPHGPGWSAPSRVGAASGAAALAAAAAAVEPWVTRSDGTFRATPASPGRIRAVVRHPQFVEAQSDLVTLDPGGEAHVDVVLHAGGTLEGRVLDARDRPVEGARVVVSAVRGSLERTTRTASDGTFAFASLPDAISLTAGVDNSDDQPDVRMTLEVPDGGKRDVTIHLPEPRGALAVSVVDDRDRPVAAAQVSASSLAADAPLRTTAFTDDRGAAALKRARGVPLRIEASAPGYAPRVVTSDGASAELKVELSPAESATGEVVEARGRAPIAGAEVTLYTDLGVRRARTDANGAFLLRDLASGSATLRVRAAGFAPSSSAITVPDSRGRRPYAIPRVELEAEGAVEGDVVDARGDPVPGARVARDHVPTWLVVGANPQGVATSDAKGRFSLKELPEGNISLEAYAPDRGRARVDGVHVTAGRTTVGVHIVLGAAAPDPARGHESSATGSVAVTLGETGVAGEVVIVSLVEGSEAERSGLAPGDVLVSVDGASVTTIEDARAKLSGPLADDVVVRVRRGDQTLALRVGREALRR